MAIEMTIAGKEVFMQKFFSKQDRDSALEALQGKDSVLFVDTPSTEHLHATIVALQEQGTGVFLRDHHGIETPKNDREQQIKTAAEAVKGLLGNNAVISTREEHPACSSLVETGEFSHVDLIIADPDPDGLLGSMKALGVIYPQLDSDAAVLDGPRSEQTPKSLSETAMLLVKGMATLPPYNPKNPSIAENAKAELFSAFVETVQGYAEAKEWLESKVEAYEAGVQNAKVLLETVTKPIVICNYVDTIGAGRYDLQTLSLGMENGAKITVIRKDVGPIAAATGVQYSLAVVREHQQDINLQDLLPEGFESSVESGIISNTSFLLHVSEAVWEDSVLPALKAMLPSPGDILPEAALRNLEEFNK